MRTIVSGACGRTGSLVTRAIAGSDELELVGAVEAPDCGAVGRLLRDVLPGCDSAAPVYASLDSIEPDGYDVIVDFSTPEQAVRCARAAGPTGKGLVVGTTGLSSDQRRSIEAAGSRSAVVLASNMSVGANVLFALARRALTALGPGYDVEIVETHHRSKTDAPSGTALRIAEVVAAARGDDPARVVRTGRAGRDLGRGEREIGVHSLRGGAVTGRHEVHFLSDTETVVLEHTALSREAFARGAVRAAVFAASSPPGLYGMSDVLGLSARDLSGPGGGD